MGKKNHFLIRRTCIFQILPDFTKPENVSKRFDILFNYVLGLWVFEKLRRHLIYVYFHMVTMATLKMSKHLISFYFLRKIWSIGPDVIFNSFWTDLSYFWNYTSWPARSEQVENDGKIIQCPCLKLCSKKKYMKFLILSTFYDRSEFIDQKKCRMQAINISNFRSPRQQIRVVIWVCRTNKERYNFKNSKNRISVKIYIGIQKMNKIRQLVP